MPLPRSRQCRDTHRAKGEQNVDTVHFQDEVTSEEVAVVLSVAEQLSSCDESR
jgi:hypothetical protein